MNCKSVWLKAYLEEGLPGPEHFDIVSTTVEVSAEALKDGEVAIQVSCMSVDPYLRGRIKSQGRKESGKSLMEGFVSGKVLASKSDSWKEGDLFGANLPFSSVQVVPASVVKGMWKLTGIVEEENISYGIGVLGMPGSTAYAGLDVLSIDKNQTIFISAASGAVGSLAGQLAKNVYDCTTVGTCGGPEKVELIKKQFGYDHAIDYRTVSNKDELFGALKKAVPDGIDMYFDNVGSYHFDAALLALRPKGRIAICGGIAEYNDAKTKGNLIQPLSMIYTQQRIEGFVCGEWLSGKKGNFLKDMSKWLKEGAVVVEETFYDGIENWPKAFQSLFMKNTNKGKVVVRM